MNRIVFFIIALLLVVVILFSGFGIVLAESPYSIDWVHQFSANGATGVSVDSQGNIYMVGGTLPGQSSFGAGDTFIRKYNKAGVEQWTHQFGTAGDDNPTGIAIDSLNNIYVVGQTSGSFPGYSSSGSGDSYVLKCNSDGVEQWIKQFGSSYSNYATDVAVDSSGNVYVAGLIQGVLPDQNSAGSEDSYIRKYNSAGVEQWTRQFGAAGYDYASGIITDHTGNVYVVGTILEGSLPGQSSLGDADLYIRKYNNAGVEQWTRQFGTACYDSVSRSAVDFSGNIYIAGSTQGSFSGCTNSGDYDAFTCKYDGTGAREWTYQFGTAGMDSAAAVTVDSVGNIFVAGDTYGAFSGYANSGSNDGFVCKFNSTGVEQWKSQFGTYGMEYPGGIACNALGSIYVVGQTTGAFPGQTNTDGFNAFIISSSNACYLPGDANGDGIINAVDITAVERIVAGLDTATPGADANQDGELNARDITGVERKIAGLD